MMATPIETDPAFLAGEAAVLFEDFFAMPDSYTAQYDVADDGERFVMVQNENVPTTEIRVVQNWFEELTQRVPTKN
jgi:hypothetical protein